MCHNNKNKETTKSERYEEKVVTFAIILIIGIIMLNFII